MELVKRLATEQTHNDKAYQYYDQLLFDAYNRGDQGNGQIDNVDGRLQFVMYGMDGRDRYQDSKSDPAPDYGFNLFKRGNRMFTALFGVRSPTVRFIPIDKRNPLHIKAARTANRVNMAYENVSDPEAMQSYLSYLAGKSGPVFGHTRWVSSREFGRRFVPKLAEQEFPLSPPAFDCPECGMTGFESDLDPAWGRYCPGCGAALSDEDFDEGLSVTEMVETDETEEILNGSVVCTLHTLASVHIPPGYRKLSDTPWLFHLEERDVGEVAAVYKLPVSAIRPYSGSSLDSLAGANVRAAIGNYTGWGTAAAQTNKTTVGRYWLQPSQYSLIQDDAVRAILESEYERGLKLTVVGEKPVRIEHESHTEVWAECMPEEGDTLLMKPYLADSIPLTDLYNDAMMLNIEAVEHSIPLQLFDPDIVPRDEINRHGRQHGAFIPSKQRGRDLSKAVASFRTSEYRPETSQLAETIFDKNDILQGFLPIIWGSVAGAETAYETSSAKNAALAMLAIPWAKQRQFHQKQRTQALLQIARYSDGILHLPVAEHPEPSNAFQVATIEDLEIILGGGWKAKADEQMPVSAGQIQDRITHLLSAEFPPQVQESLGLLSAQNIPYIHAYLGVPGMRSPLLEEVESLEQLKEQLLMAAPTEDPATGQLMPSEQPDPFLYRPQMVLEMFRPWLVSEEGRNERERNLAGWMNVRAYVELSEIAMQQMAPPPEEQPEGAPLAEPATAPMP